jgi:hypothetical protein
VRPLVEVTGALGMAGSFANGENVSSQNRESTETLQTRDPEINCAQEANPIVYPAAELLTVRYRSSHKRL